MIKTTPAQFFRQVRQEISKVIWPTRKEAFSISIFVIIMIVISSLFFSVVDRLCAWVIRLIVGFGG